MGFIVSFPRSLRLWAGVLLALFTITQAGASPQIVAPKGSLHISADTAAFHFDFEKDHGAFVQKAVGRIPLQRYSVSFLHVDPGPSGYSKHLVWFLARDIHGFSILWCYLDDAGKEFYCWLYEYQKNLLTTQKFTGDYTYAPPATVSDTLEPGFALLDQPVYTGPDFSFSGWSRKSGSLARMDLSESITTEDRPKGTIVEPDASAGSAAAIRSLQKLTVYPLHQLKVGGANGWRSAGWEELHAIAYDSAKDPYYIILYSNSKRGFVIDVKRARTYTTEFDSSVAFNVGQKGFGPKGTTQDKTENPTVARNQPFEIVLSSAKAYDNPYTDVLLDVELVGPDRRTIRLPGYWDGGKIWKIRFAPPKIGIWTWKSFSNDKELDSKLGVLECTLEPDPSTGFVRVHPYKTHSRHFAVGQNTAFFPASAFDPVQSDVIATPIAAVRAASFEGAPQSSGTDPASYKAFQSRMDALHAAGFNRLSGGFVISGDTATGEPKNEGGNPFIGGDLYHLNADYFKWMEKRIAYANSVGLIPDIGLAKSPAIAFLGNNDLQLRTLWRYILARFGTFDVEWNMFGPVAADSKEALDRITPFALMANKFDLFHHPLTTGLIVTDAYVKKVMTAAAKPKSSTGSTGQSVNGIGLPIQDGPPMGLPLWLDVVTLYSTDTNTLYDLTTVKKPLVIVADGASALASPDEARGIMWGTRLRGAYYTTDGTAFATSSLDTGFAKAVEVCNSFIKNTHYGRMDPHMELLTAREETPEQRKSRILANIQAGIPPETGAPAAVGQAKVEPAAVLLADTSREYLLYFKHGGNINLDLLEATGHMKVTWLNPRTGETKDDPSFVGGSYHAFSAPDDKDWVLYLKRYANN